MALVLKDLVREVAKAANFSKPEGRVLVNRILTAMQDALARGERIEIREFGSLGTRVVKGRVGRDMNRGLSIPLPPMTKVVFKPGRAWKPGAGEPERVPDSSGQLLMFG